MSGNFTVLGLFGPARSGKDLVADWLHEEKGFQKVAFADPMKRFVHDLFLYPNEILWGPSELRDIVRDVGDEFWMSALSRFSSVAGQFIAEVVEEPFKVTAFLKLMDWFTWLRKTYPTEISARVILQTMGTEWGRAVDPRMWLKYGWNKVIPQLADGNIYTQTGGIRQASIPFSHAGAVITDHRFHNEIEESQKRGGYVLRLRRLAIEARTDNVGIQGHQSEAEGKKIPDYAFDRVLEFPEGVEHVYRILEEVFKEQAWKLKRSSSTE